MSFFVEVVAAIAAIAAVVAVVFSAFLAAWFAHKAVGEAKRQNDIARLEKQLELSDALREFRIAISEGPDYPEDAHWKFFRAAQLSEFYFPFEISEEYGDIYNYAHDGRMRIPESAFAEQVNKELRQRCNDLSEKIRSYLKLAHPMN